MLHDSEVHLPAPYPPASFRLLSLCPSRQITRTCRTWITTQSKTNKCSDRSGALCRKSCVAVTALRHTPKTSRLASHAFGCFMDAQPGWKNCPSPQSPPEARNTRVQLSPSSWHRIAMRPTRQCGGGPIQHWAACCSVTSLLPSCTSVMESHMESPNLSLEGTSDMDAPETNRLACARGLRKFRCKKRKLREPEAAVMVSSKTCQLQT